MRAFLVLVACAGAKPVPSMHHAAASRDAGADSAIEAPFVSFDEIADQKNRVAPGMHEVLRADVPSDAGAMLVVAGDADTCVRALVRAKDDVRADLVSNGDTLATSTGHDITLAPRGPVCFRKGESAELVIVSDAGVRARAIVWASP